MIIPQQVYQGLDSLLLLAIPLFLLAGDLMTLGGITERLLGFSQRAVRPLPRRPGDEQRGLGDASWPASRARPWPTPARSARC
jgi:hypothetical protein